MPNDKLETNEDVDVLCKKILIKFQEIKYLNHKLDNYLSNKFDCFDKSNTDELFEKLEETEYYFDELIYNYEKIKPLITIARKMNYEKNKNN